LSCLFPLPFCLLLSSDFELLPNTPLHLFQVYNVILEILKIHVLCVPIRTLIIFMSISFPLGAPNSTCFVAWQWSSIFMVLPSKIPKFAIQPHNSRHNEVDMFYQGRTCMEHFGVLTISNSCSEREKTRTNTKHSKWLAKVIKSASPLLMCLHSIPLMFHSRSLFTRSQVSCSTSKWKT